MAKVLNGEKHCRKFQSHERYRKQTTDRQTDGRAMTYSERERDAKNVSYTNQMP